MSRLKEVAAHGKLTVSHQVHPCSAKISSYLLETVWSLGSIIYAPSKNFIKDLSNHVTEIKFRLGICSHVECSNLCMKKVGQAGRGTLDCAKMVPGEMVPKPLFS